MSSIESQILAFGDLPESWNFGEGSPPSKEVINKALDVYWIGKRFELECQVFPGDGEIVVSFNKNSHFMDFCVTRDLKIEFVHEHGIGFTYETIEENNDFSKQDIITKITELSQKE